MIRKSQFSIIELMTVILIILLLISLTIPIFFNVKKNARSTLCRSQLRQLGILVTSYSSDHGGYLPNDDAFNRKTDPYPYVYSDLGWYTKYGDNNNFYQNWSGHLLPYLNFNMPQKYFRGVNGKVVSSSGSPYVEIQPVPTPAEGMYKNGWVVLDAALHKGGYEELKVLICPEVSNNSFDVSGILTYNGLKVPRINALMEQAGGRGVPTTYLANSIYFGRNSTYYDAKIDSQRLDEIDNLSGKALLLEGGLAFPDDKCSSPYYFPTNNYNLSNSGGLIANFDKGDEGNHKLSFIHENQVEFWIKGGKKKNIFAFDTKGKYRELAIKFNEQFKGKAMMIAGAETAAHWGMMYSIVSYVDPENGTIFESFFKANSSLSPLNNWDYFIDGQENDYSALVGEMNVLFGDGAVLTKDNAWLCNNRMQIADSAF